MSSSARDHLLDQLDDYVRGHMPDAQASAYEDELFARALSSEAPELSFRRELGQTFRQMAARGTLDLWLTARGVEELRASGPRPGVFWK